MEVGDEAGLEVVVGICEGVSVAEVVRVGLGAGLRIQERPANLVQKMVLRWEW